MFIRQNSLRRISCVNTLNKNSSNNTSKNSKHSKLQNFSSPYYARKSRIISSKKPSLNLRGIETLNSNKIKSYKIKRNSRVSMTKIINKKEIERFYNNKKVNLKSIIKYIKKQFINKYNNISYFNLDNNILNDNTNYYFESDYYAINDLLNKKKFNLTILLKEYDIFYNKQEILIKYYEKKERYIIMKYLLSFVYKYDELCFNIKKEIYDKEEKEELIKTFHYITSNKYLYEHLLDIDSFKGIKYLLKRVNLNSKKAQYDYSYLDIMKNKIVSEENKYIINAIKVLIEFMNNRKFIEKKLIKNIPFEKVPNCVPNYYPLGYELNSSLNNYKISKKYKKITKPGDNTKELINSIIKENSKNDNISNNLIEKKNVLFNIDEKPTENESSLGDSENNYLKTKNKKKETNIKKIDNNNNNLNNNLLPLSLYEITEKEEKTDKDEELIIDKDNATKIGYKINDMFKSSNSDIRGGRDPDINDIEYFLYIFPKEKYKNNFINLNSTKSLKKINNNSNKNIKEVKKIFNNNDRTPKKISKFYKKRFKGISVELENNFKKNINLNNKIVSPKKKKLNLLSNIKNNYNNKQNYFTQRRKIQNKNTDLILSSISNRRNEKYNKKFIKNNKINSLILSQLSNNNISSTLFSDINHLSQNISYSPSNLDKKEQKFLLNKNNYNNLKNNFSFDNNKNKRNNKRIYKFKNTEDFIQGLKKFYNRINVKPNLLLKNLSAYHNSNSSFETKTKSLSSSPTKRIIISNGNSPKNSTEKYMYDGYNSKIKNISNYIKSQYIRQKKKETNNITFKQIVKNSNIYSSQFL